MWIDVVKPSITWRGKSRSWEKFFGDRRHSHDICEKDLSKKALNRKCLFNFLINKSVSPVSEKECSRCPDLWIVQVILAFNKNNIESVINWGQICWIGSYIRLPLELTDAARVKDYMLVFFCWQNASNSTKISTFAFFLAADKHAICVVDVNMHWSLWIRSFLGDEGEVPASVIYYHFLSSLFIISYSIFFCYYHYFFAVLISHG